MRFNRNKDANHDALADIYRAAGCSFVDTHVVGGGYPDGNVGCVGVTDLVEFKIDDGGDPLKQLEPNQVTFSRDWRGSRVRIVRNMDEAMAHIRHMRARGIKL